MAGCGKVMVCATWVELPVPLRETLCVVPGLAFRLVSVMTSWPVVAPAAVGPNSMLLVQLAPAARVPGFMEVVAESSGQVDDAPRRKPAAMLGFKPVAGTGKLRSALPMFCRVTDCGRLVAPHIGVCEAQGWRRGERNLLHHRVVRVCHVHISRTVDRHAKGKAKVAAEVDHVGRRGSRTSDRNDFFHRRIRRIGDIYVACGVDCKERRGIETVARCKGLHGRGSGGDSVHRENLVHQGVSAIGHITHCQHRRQPRHTASQTQSQWPGSVRSMKKR